jgi:hypothetical protein
MNSDQDAHESPNIETNRLASQHTSPQACLAVLQGAVVEEETTAAVEFGVRWHGPGAFRQPGPLNWSAPPWLPGALRESHSQRGFTRPTAVSFGYRLGTPAVAFDFGAGGGTTAAKKRSPPPKTKAGKVAVTIKQPLGVVCDISVEILDDTIGKDAGSGGVTDCRWKDKVPKFDAPAPVYDTSSRLAIVSSITKGAKATGVLVIQTTYRKRGLEAEYSGYGRGTTADDIKAGNVTLGFHESCHRNDFINYLNTQKLPDFDGAPGMVGQDFNDDWRAFMDAFQALPKTMKAWSVELTDNVGKTKATWEAGHKKKASPGARDK